MTKGLIPISLAALLACAGCAVRTGARPADTTTEGASRGAAPAASTPKAAPSAPVAADRPAAGNGSTEAPKAAAVEAYQSATGRPEVVRPVEDRQVPAATASAFVFSPQQAVPAQPSIPSTAERSPIEPPAEASPGELQLDVIASASQIAPGGIMTVDVIARSSSAVVDAPLHLMFDSSVVEFVDGATGDFLTHGGSSVVFLADGRSRPGEVAIAAGRVEREQGARGTGLLCRVTFRGVGAGTTPVLVAHAKAWGTRGEELTVVGGGTSIAVD